MGIRPRDVINALERCHGGVLRAADTDAAVKLLRSMCMRSGQIGELRERLHEMAETDQLTIEHEGRRFNLIATPQALATETKDEGQTMVAPPGRRRTTAPRDGMGRELPAHLGPEHVGPLQVSYQVPEAGEAIAAAAMLVFEEVVQSGKHRHGRSEFIAAAQAILLSLYDGKAEVAQTLVTPVLCYLVDNGHAKRIPVPGRNSEAIIELIVPQQPPDEAVRIVQETDPVELLARLAPELEAARERLAELEARLENAADPETVARLAEKAEELQAANEGLLRKLEAAGSEKERLVASHRQKLTSLRSEHRAALTAQRREHEAALVAVQKELEEARAENAELKSAAQRRELPADLQLRVKKLLGE